MKKIKIPNILKIIFAFCFLCMLSYNVYADDVVYSTEGGTWKQINDTTYTMDKDGDGTTDITLIKNDNEWQYIFTVADDKATYYAWEEDVPEGYEVVGKGTRANPAVNNQTKYSHTPNVSDDGTQSGNYANNLNLNDVVTLDGADKLHVVLKYAGESASYDYVCAWQGSQPGYTASNNYSSAISVNGTQKFGGSNGTTVEFDVPGDTVTFGYRSDGSGCGNGFGYYAIVTGTGKGLTITNRSIDNPAPETGAIELTKNVKGKGEVTKYSHTANINDDGTQNGNYTNNLNTNEVITIPGASQLHVVLKYAGEGDSWDYVCAWQGAHSGYTASNNSGSAISVNGKQKFGGGNGATVEFDVDGESVTFGFRSDSSGCGNGFGYYAVVTGNAGSTDGPNEYFKFNIHLSSDNAELAPLIDGDHVFGNISFKDGDGFVYLATGDTVTLDKIPDGVNYTITEDKNEDYNISWSGTTGNGTDNTYSGTIAANTTNEILCTNTYAKQSSGGTTEHPVDIGSLKLVKQFVNVTGNKNASFHIAFWNLDKNTAYKYSDGTTESSFTSDSTGLADVALSITDDKEFTFSDLPAGCQYQISEEANDNIASYEISGVANVTQQRGENPDVNQVLTTAKETIAKDENAVVTFKNSGKEIPKEADEIVDIHVEKVWNDNNDAAKMRPDSIDVQLTQDGDVVVTAVLDNDTNWQADFTGLDKFADDGVTEYEYKVNEIDVAGYKSEITSTASADGKTKSFVITNTLIDIGNLKISKTVTGADADLTKDFKFALTLKKNGKPFSGVFELDAKDGTKTGTAAFDENGATSFTLKHGESICIKNLPAGVTYEVKETVPAGYTEANGGKYSGTVVKGKTQSVNVSNAYSQSYQLIVKKTVKGNQGDKVSDFKFQIMLTGNSIPKNINVIKNGKADNITLTNGIAEFTLAHGDEITFEKIPSQSKYTITELDGESRGYTVSSTNASGTLSKNTEVSFVNTKNVGVPTAAMTNTTAIAGIVIVCIICVAVMIRKKSKKEK